VLDLASEKHPSDHASNVGMTQRSISLSLLGTSCFRRFQLTNGWALLLRRKRISLITSALLIRTALISTVALPCIVSNVASDTSVSAAATFIPAQEMAHSAYDFTNSVGANTHINYFDSTYGNFALLERELKSIGILHLRDGIHLQNSDYNAAIYGRWIQLGKLRIQFDAVLDPRSDLPPVTGALLANVEDLAGKTIESFEGPNELDVSKLKDWSSTDRDYQEAIFNSTKSIGTGSAIRVVGPSLAFARNASDLNDIGDRTDEINLHPYPAGNIPSAIFPEQINFAKIMSSDKQIIFTETGYHNGLNDHRDQPAVSEAAAAKYIPRLFLENFARGISRTYLYEFMDEKPDPGLTDNQLHWGLVRADGSEKPAFSALKNLAAELRDTEEPPHLETLKWNLSINDTRIHHLLLQKANGVFELVLWQEVASFDLKRQADLNNPRVDAELQLNQAAQRVTIFEPSTQPDPVNTYDKVSKIPLAIPDAPLVVEIASR
jgi:hypothetical protein